MTNADKTIEAVVKRKIRADFELTLARFSYYVSDDCIDALVDDVFKTFGIGRAE